MEIVYKKRFLDKIKKTNNCWLWQASCHKQGYGWFRLNNRMRLAHQIAYELFIGKIPLGKCVLHKCDNPPCVNPKHLFLGTQSDNNKDASKKGRSRGISRPGELNPVAKLTALQVQEIRNQYKIGYIMQKQLAQKFNVSVSHISHIVNGKSWNCMSIGD